MANYNQWGNQHNFKHGLSKHPIYWIWRGMKQRCNNPNYKHYDAYGGRGIKICDEWLDVVKFYNWAMDNGWEKRLTIDRIDNNGNYSPENCRCVDMVVQANNRRDSTGVAVFCRKHGLLKYYASIWRDLKNSKSVDFVIDKYRRKLITEKKTT